MCIQRDTIFGKHSGASSGRSDSKATSHITAKKTRSRTTELRETLAPEKKSASGFHQQKDARQGLYVAVRHPQ